MAFLFEAHCGDCGRSFWRPEASDFGYGSAILTREDGAAFLSFDATGPAHADIAKRVSRALDVAGRPDGPLFAVVAKLADTVDGIGFRHRHICPHCGGTADTWAGERGDPVEVHPATFDDFRSASPEEQQRRIEAALQSG